MAAHDYVCYWATGKQLIHGENPYDKQAIFSLEQTAGYWATNKPLLMRNPPTALFVTLPLGLLGAYTGSLVWLLILSASLIVSVQLLWATHGKPSNRLHLLGLCFAPCIACLSNGQTGIFALLGLAIFLRFHLAKPIIAGSALALCALKPHLFFPFWTAILVWAAWQRHYRIIVGIVLALATSLGIALWFDPLVWSHYSEMMRSDGIEREFVPTISLLFRLSVQRNAMWVQFLPAATASLWAAVYTWRRRKRWNWSTDGSLLILVSVLVAPYAWFTDQAVLWPAVLHGFYLARKPARAALVALMAAMTTQLLFASMHSALWIWPPIALLVWFLYTLNVNASSTRRLVRDPVDANDSSKRSGDGSTSLTRSSVKSASIY
jgi:hypothetical protein